LRLLAVHAHTRRLELACRIAPNVPDFLMGDSPRLQQCLLNLVGNSLKFTPKGEILVSVAVEEQRATDVVLRFVVRDTGIGIAPQYHKSIFRPFEQANTSTTRPHGGTGLGLAIVAKLVYLMDGRIVVDSALGAGSTFTFTARFDLDLE